MNIMLGIIGGMGPLATVNLFEKIVFHTEANCDQDHIHILIDNNTSIPDRTSYLIGRGEDPRKYLIESAKRLEAMGADYLIMPCNTAHYFYEDIIEEISIPFLNMIEETAKLIKGEYSGISKIGLLATEGTCKTGIYERIFNEYEIEIVKPTKTYQKYVTDFIYGIKEDRDEINVEGLYKAVEDMKKKDVEIFILGCTELSVGYRMFEMEGNYVDPLEIIAIGAINFAGKNAKKCSWSYQNIDIIEKRAKEA